MNLQKKESWIEQGEKLKYQLYHLNFEIGDWLNQGEDLEEYSQYTDWLDLAQQNKLKKISKMFPTCRGKLSYTSYEYLSRIKDETARNNLLKQAISNKWRSKEVNEKVREYLNRSRNNSNNNSNHLDN